MRTWMMAVCAALALAGAAAGADDATERDRPWGVGYDSGLTVRRLLGPWEVGVAAGPNDHLGDSYEHTWDPQWPDSLQGVLTDKGSSRREAGFVRLHLARRLATYRTLALGGVLGGSYSWSNESRENWYYYRSSGDWRVDRSEEFADTWTLRLGARIAWRPVPFISLEQEFGLMYSWREFERERWDRQANQPEVYSYESGRTQSFEHYGPYDPTYNLRIVVWF